MGYYKTPEEMFDARSEYCKRDGDRHWAMAKNGRGGVHYSKARDCYNQAAENKRKAKQARAAGASFGGAGRKNERKG